METWWDISHDWSAVTNGYGLFRKDRPERQGGRVTPYVRTGKEPVKSLQVKISRQNNMVVAVVGACYRCPNQG